MSSSTVLEPGETETDDAVFDQTCWDAVRFTVDGDSPENNGGRVACYPAPRDEDDGSFLTGQVDSSGEFSWVVSATNDAGPFD